MREIDEHLHLMSHHIGEANQEPDDLGLVHFKILQIKDLCVKIDRIIINKRNERT